MPDINTLPRRVAHDPGGSDDESDVVPIADAEIPLYFATRHGRLFHSHGNTYPLPIDGAEQRVRFLIIALFVLRKLNELTLFAPSRSHLS